MLGVVSMLAGLVAVVMEGVEMCWDHLVVAAFSIGIQHQIRLPAEACRNLGRNTVVKYLVAVIASSNRC